MKRVRRTRAYYNENDPFAAQWLRNLIEEGLLPWGDVDARSIKEVETSDLVGYRQCHFFAGIGGWPYALRLAGWGDDREVWTGSCPCQSLSVAGKKMGTNDPRHLWPDFYRLIEERKPPTIFGEQVASKDGQVWFAGVRADLELLEYGVGAADLPAACASLPQVRQRLYWVADSESRRSRTAKSGDRHKEVKRGRTIEAASYRRYTDQFGNHYRIPKSEVPFVVNGFPGILDQIRAAGNAIPPQVAARFIQATE